MPQNIPVAQVSEVNGEISCSIEETNRIRAQLGLKPLRVNSTKPTPRDGPTPKASVTESNGEISCSIEETNRIRAELGLKPLRESSKKIVHVDVTAADKSNALADRLAKAKKKRQLNEQLHGTTLADETESSAASWVQQSRARAEQRKQELERAARAQVQAATHKEDYSAKDLQGLKLAHNAKDFNEGDQVVLTLKDSSVIDHDTGDLAVQGGDELENVEMASLARTQKKHKQLTKNKRSNLYQAYDDEEFDDMGAPKKRKVLSKYDEDEQEQVESAPAHVIGQDGQVSTSKEDQLAASIHAKLNEQQSLESSAGLFSVSDYLTKEEMPKKPLKMKKKKKRKKSKSKSRSMADQLESMETSTAAGESQSQDAAAATIRPRAIGTSDAFLDTVNEDADDLQESLARARMATLSRKKRPKTDHAQFVLNQVSEIAKREEEQVARIKQDPTRVVLNATTEFAHNIEARMQERTDHRNARTANNGGPSTTAMDVDNQQAGAGPVSTSSSVDHGANKAGKLTGGAADILRPEDSGAQPVARGLGATLALLRQKGSLSQDAGFVAGRARDERPVQDDGKTGFKIEHRDEHGRLLTQKEAFRQLSYKFHGVKAGKNKTEKRQKQLEEQLKMKQMVGNDTPLGAGAAMRASLQDKGKAYIVLGGGNSSRGRR